MAVTPRIPSHTDVRSVVPTARRPELPADYRRIPSRVNFTDHVVTRHVREGRGHRPALHHEGTTLTYAQLDASVNRCGHALLALGVERGSRFVLRGPNSPHYVALFLAGLKIGAVPIPSNSLFREWEVEHIIRNSEAVAVFTTDALAATVGRVGPGCPSLRVVVSLDGDPDGPPEHDRPTVDALIAGQPDELEAADTAADDLAFIIYTSGTTQSPKGVEHAHRTVVANVDPVRHELMQLTPDDVCLQPQEISFIYSLICGLVAPLTAGAQVVLYGGRFDPHRTLAAVERYGVTELVGVPTIFRMLVTAGGLDGYDVSSVRMGISGGEPLAEHTFHEVRRRFGVDVYDLIGQTEAWIFMSNRPGLPIKPGSLGLPLTGRETSIRDLDGNEVADGEVGRLCLRADDPGLALGFRGQPELWAARFSGGWFDTGDLAHRDADGYYWYVSRSDDLIKSRAYLISPGEVEAAALEHPAVLEAAVIGVPDEVLGQHVRAYVVLKEGHTAADALAAGIIEAIRAVIAPYKAPREIEFLAELPKTASGKIRRTELRRRAAPTTP